jgi:UDP-N-acetylglucosamine 1-carboxyvinyltransferase
MAHLVIHGGRKLRGTIVNQSAKNSAVALLCAAVMIEGKTVLSDVPDIEEVDRIIELLESIGVRVARLKPGTIEIDATGPISMEKIDRSACEKTRSSLMLLGALAARVRTYKLYRTGGCKLGERTVRPHLYALEQLGVQVVSREHYYEVTNHQLRAEYIVMYESGDTPTENAVMAAVLAPGVTTIKFASANYMVQDLCYFLIKAGAKIRGIGTTTLTITGVKKLKPVHNYPLIPDPIVAMSYIAIAITTHSRLTIANCPLDFLELELLKLKTMGQKYTLSAKRLSKNGKFSVVDIEIIPSRLRALPDKLECRPFPGLNIDNLPLFVPILTQAKGRTLVHDWVYENRAIYFSELKKLGAHIDAVDIHRVWVEGPTVFSPNDLEAPPALRPAVDMLICMLATKGVSVLRNTYQIDRGYERLYDTLNMVGARIEVHNS